MAVTFLSAEWLETLVAEAEGLPEVDGVDLTVQYEVAGAPDGKVRFFLEWRSGRLAEAALGKNADAEVFIQVKSPDALRLLNGELDADVAYMQGRLKIDGEYRKFVVDHRDWRRSDAQRELWARMAELTSD
ncbi:MAG: SCP2 sterol-binding domain-containing protein [Acidimicrobiales bacterium]